MQRNAGIGIDEDHLALADTVRRWCDARCPPSVPRAHLDAEADMLPAFWDELAELGWLGLHVAEEHGGQGYGLIELGVVLEELGRVLAPGPMVPTVTASVVIGRFADDELGPAVLADLASGATVGAVALAGEPVPARPADSQDGGLMVDGTWEPVPSGALADRFILPVTVGPGAGPGRDVDDGDQDAADETWVVVDAADVAVEALPGVDRTRPPARVRATELPVAPERIVTAPAGAGGVRGLGALMASAEAVGVAAWCVGTAATHAKVREQFGRPIGQFQAVKHRCADMLCALEQARAATWDALRTGGDGDSVALATAAAAALTPEAAYSCAKDAIQVLGGIGFTWDHDAHLYLKRAMTTRLLVGPGETWQAEAATLARAGIRRDAGIALPPEAEGYRTEVRGFLDDVRAGDKSTWNGRIADAGYLVPHWPEPWGRDASPLEQLVIDEEFRQARVRRPHLAVGAWALPTIIAHGTTDQQERWIPATLRGELTWCQMFSEPGAGSDLASLSTKAIRTDGGWLLTGQKVWTTLAHQADWGICLARTDPDAPKHEGLGCFLVDMTSAGLDIRPLRELTGAEMFNEVFLSDVFVPDDCVVGGPTEGWEAARTTLGNERVSMGSGASMGPGVEALLDLAERTGALDDSRRAPMVGAAVVTSQSLAALGARMTLRALAGAEAGPDASVRKLLGVEADQRTQEIGLDLLGPAGATGEGLSAEWVAGFLGNRSLSIAGGTSEIQRNVIAERLLDLPRD